MEEGSEREGSFGGGTSLGCEGRKTGEDTRGDCSISNNNNTIAGDTDERTQAPINSFIRDFNNTRTQEHTRMKILVNA